METYFCKAVGLGVWETLEGGSVIEVMVVNSKFIPPEGLLICLSSFLLSVYQLVVKEERLQKSRRALTSSSAFQCPWATGTPQPWLSTLLCCRIEACQPACHPAIYSGWQQDIQWLLEPSPLSPLKSYSIYFQALSKANGVSMAKWRPFLALFSHS